MPKKELKTEAQKAASILGKLSAKKKPKAREELSEMGRRSAEKRWGKKYKKKEITQK